MSTTTIILTMIGIYYLYDGILNCYRFFTERLDVEILGYIALERYVNGIMFSILMGIFAIMLGWALDLDLYLIAITVFVLNIIQNTRFKLRLREEKKRDYFKEELEHYQNIIDDPEADPSSKDAAKHLRKMSIRFKSEKINNNE